MATDFRGQLERGLDQLALSLPETAVDRLAQYLVLLEKWNRAYNLTAVPAVEWVPRHLLDSLVVAGFLQGERFADVGTGAGLPGIPLAITYPDRQFQLIDSNGKKIRFVTQAINELGLTNARAAQSRVEQWQPQPGYDAVLSRAFTSLEDMARMCEHLLAPNGCLLALKGVYPADELSALPKHFTVDACHSLRVPGVDGERHLVVIRPDRAGLTT